MKSKRAASDQPMDQSEFLAASTDEMTTSVSAAAHGRPFSLLRSLAEPNRFALERIIGRGGQAQVWRARDQSLGREVAIKEMRSANRADEDLVQRFLTEAQITGQLEHPGIVPLHELGARPDGSPFYVMKLLRGNTLAKAIEEFHSLGPEVPGRLLKFRNLLRILIDICNAVAFAHNRGVIHRDLKPQNVVLGEFGEAIVVDWGIAKIVGTRRWNRVHVAGRNFAGPAGTGSKRGFVLTKRQRRQPDGAGQLVGNDLVHVTRASSW